MTEETRQIIVDPSPLLNETIKSILPQGLPSVSQINSMDDNERHLLYLSQQLIIHQFQKLVNDEIHNVEVVLSSVDNMIKCKEEPKGTNIKPTLFQRIGKRIPPIRIPPKLIIILFIIVIIISIYCYLFTFTYQIE